MWVQKGKQTYVCKHACIHTHTHFLENNFRNPGKQLVWKILLKVMLKFLGPTNCMQLSATRLSVIPNISWFFSLLVVLVCASHQCSSEGWCVWSGVRHLAGSTVAYIMEETMASLGGLRAASWVSISTTIPPVVEYSIWGLYPGLEGG